MEVKGFQGQRITGDHAEYDTARAVRNGAIDGLGSTGARLTFAATSTATPSPPRAALPQIKTEEWEWQL